MNYIWAFMMLISVFSAIVTGRVEALSNAILNGATEAVNLIISLLGIMALWTGLMKIAETSGLTQALARIFRPIFRILFKDLYTEKTQESPALKAISMNVTANLLGLGNAATPFGIKAVSEMQKLNPELSTATNSMIMFIVLNSASLQLIPTTVLFLRQKYGSANPMEILPAMWITSIISLIFGVLLTKTIERLEKLPRIQKINLKPSKTAQKQVL